MWTLCRIFKRTSNYCRKQVAKADDQWRKLPSIHDDPIGNSELKNGNISDIGIWNKLDCQIHDTSSNGINLLNMSNMIHNIKDNDLILSDDQFNMETPNFSCFGSLYTNEDWDELGAVVNAACSQFPLNSSWSYILDYYLYHSYNYDLYMDNCSYRSAIYINIYTCSSFQFRISYEIYGI